jgi:5'-3' exoribonuclease 2
MEKKVFHCPEVILSDSSFPGEGEHKILPLIRKLRYNDPNGNIVIMSPDNDLISLGILTGKSNIYILRYIEYITATLLKKETYNKNSLISIDLDILRKEFQKEHIHSSTFDEMNLLLDYNFLLSMVGNDFVPVLPYLKIKNGGLDRLIKLYHQIYEIKKEYLIHKETLDINISFFIEIILILSKMERNDWNNLNLFLKRESSGSQEPRNEDNLSKEKIYENRLNHLYMANPYHPLFDLYKNDFKKIPFDSPIHIWKPQYYEYFCDINKDNYNKTRNNMVFEYLKSLKFTLLYYNRKCPSWSWYYPYRVAPLFSDIYTNLTKFNLDINKDIQFKQGIPYSPFQQLMFILPPQSKAIVPKPFHELFEKYKKYYPIEFRVDAIQGLKYIYSEAILPEWDCFSDLLKDIKSIEKNISPKEKERNRIHFQLYRM